jgi:hypothetical protein
VRSLPGPGGYAVTRFPGLRLIDRSVKGRRRPILNHLVNFSTGRASRVMSSRINVRTCGGNEGVSEATEKLRDNPPGVRGKGGFVLDSPHGYLLELFDWPT